MGPRAVIIPFITRYCSWRLQNPSELLKHRRVILNLQMLHVIAQCFSLTSMPIGSTPRCYKTRQKSRESVYRLYWMSSFFQWKITAIIRLKSLTNKTEITLQFIFRTEENRQLVQFFSPKDDINTALYTTDQEGLSLHI